MEPDMNTGEGVRVRHGGEEGASDMGARRIRGVEQRKMARRVTDLGRLHCWAVRSNRTREMGLRGGKQSRAGREPRGIGGAGRRPKRKEKDGPREGNAGPRVEKEKWATRERPKEREEPRPFG